MTAELIEIVQYNGQSLSQTRALYRSVSPQLFRVRECRLDRSQDKLPCTGIKIDGSSELFSEFEPWSWTFRSHQTSECTVESPILVARDGEGSSSLTQVIRLQWCSRPRAYSGNDYTEAAACLLHRNWCVVHMKYYIPCLELWNQLGRILWFRVDPRSSHRTILANTGCATPIWIPRKHCGTAIYLVIYTCEPESQDCAVLSPLHLYIASLQHFLCPWTAPSLQPKESAFYSKTAKALRSDIGYPQQWLQ